MTAVARRLVGIAILGAIFVFFLAAGGMNFLIGFGISIVLVALVSIAMYLISGGI